MIRYDPPVITSVAFRLPGGLDQSDDLWKVLCDPSWSSFSPAPLSRRIGDKHVISYTEGNVNTGWLGSNGVEQFDPAFFNITPGEAERLRPNSRLTLELTWEALERAGIPPSSLRGKNVSTSIAMGAEDGWDIRRFTEDGPAAFDHHWAANSDPSGVSGRIAHFFDFRGPTVTVSNACSSAATALRQGIYSLLYDGSDIAVVGAVTTHFFPAAIEWAASTGILSEKGRCSAFSEDADGYVASEGAVMLILTRKSLAEMQNYPILGLISSLVMAHNGATRTFAAPNVSAQVELARRAISEAGIEAKDIRILEAHGTGTRLGDAMELEGIRTVHEPLRESENPLYVSSSKTVFGHCQAAACFVGILKVLSCFEHRALPPHRVKALKEYESGPIQIPMELTELGQTAPLIAQVNSFGFTGSIATVILREATEPDNDKTAVKEVQDLPCYLLPFSAKTSEALSAQIHQISRWAQQHDISVKDAAVILSLTRDHHPVRRLIPIVEWSDLLPFTKDFTLPISDVILEAGTSLVSVIGEDIFRSYLNLQARGCEFQDDILNTLLSGQRLLEAACFLYESGHNLDFYALYDRRMLKSRLIMTMPTYPFQRRLCWRTRTEFSLMQEKIANDQGLIGIDERSEAVYSPQATEESISDVVASILHMPSSAITPDTDIFDIGIDSLNSLELASNLTKAFGQKISTQDLYSQLTVRSICDWINGNSRSRASSELSQVDLEEFIERYGSLTISNPPEKLSAQIFAFPHTILLTGANGMLGSHVLLKLMKQLSVRVICLVRGDPWSKILSSFNAWGLDTELLNDARSSNRIVLLATTSLSNAHLGCSEDDYSMLIDSVDEILHLAWKMDFNLPISGFSSLIEGTVNLAELSIRCRKSVRLHFVSSFSTTFGYEGDLVPEKPLPAKAVHCLKQGYAYSKLVAEHSLYRILERNPETFQLSIIRVGQICGHSQTGSWSQDEMIPKIIMSIPTLQAVPAYLPDVSWIPSDICANVLCDLVLSSGRKDNSTCVFNVANPEILPWTFIVRSLQSALGLNYLPVVPLRNYVRLIQEHSDDDLPIAPLLPYYLSVDDDGNNRFCSLDVRETAGISASLRSCPRIDVDFVELIVETMFLEKPDIRLSVSEQVSPVLVFGTWASSVDVSEEEYNPIRGKIRAVADNAKRECGIGDLAAESPLNLQLHALEEQLISLDKLIQNNCVPCAVIGYSFGEFAAAVAAGILSEEAAVNIIVRRFSVLQDVQGTMLNVFADPPSTRRTLALLHAAPDIGIYAGPKHTILSGSLTSILAAKEALKSDGIKILSVNTTVPFHSAQVSEGAKTLELSSITPKEGHISYISGLTGSVLNGKRLRGKYWARHMREPAQFFSCMEYVRQHFPDSPIIDIGPGLGISKIITRYGWDNAKCLSVQEYLMQNTGFKRKTLHSRKSSMPSLVSGHNTSATSTATDLSQQESLYDVSQSSGENIGSSLSAALSILTGEFGYRGSRDLLHNSFQTLGIQSLDFVQFTDNLAKATGLTLPPSSYGSDETIEDIIRSSSAL